MTIPSPAGFEGYSFNARLSPGRWDLKRDVLDLIPGNPKHALRNSSEV